MTKKQCFKLADIVRETKPKFRDEDRNCSDVTASLQQWDDMRDELADFCAQQNAKFNLRNWLDYIEGKVGPNGGARS